MARIDKPTTELLDKYLLRNETLSRTVKSNPLDRIDIEIGDSLQPDFKPQFKVSRWLNEVNFSIRAQEHPAATVQIDGEIIKYITPDYEVWQYDKPDAGEDGGFEFEWRLPKKPLSNVLRTTIQSKGLNFFYQPALTQEEIAEGASRPDNVVGSYAVYHKTKGGMNRSDGMEYKVGKAFHIYRPQATDANGNKVWCDLNITGGILTVTIPQSFLDTAVYPVVVDPTFGYTTVGATPTASSGIKANVFSLSEAGDVTKITTYTGNLSGTAVGAAIYNDSSGTPGTNVATDSGSTSISTHTWYDITINASLSATSYWICHWTDVNDSYNYDTVAGNTNITDSTSSYKSWPSSLTASLTFNNRVMSIYATYTAGGGGGAEPPARSLNLLGIGI